MENKGYVIYDNHNVDYKEWFEEFKGYCMDNDINFSNYDEDSQYFHEWVWDTLNMNWEDFILNLQHDKDNNVECVVRGKVGTWRGNFEIEPKTFPTLEKAIYACVRDCDYITITQTEDGAIDVYASHHDGSHSFSIHKLNDLSYEVDEDEIDLTDEKYYDKFNIQY